MRCPHCQSDSSRVVDSRPAPEGIRRRRECEQCASRFTTYERVAQLQPMVAKRDGRREPFRREKLVTGLARACVKRPIPHADLERLAEQIETRIRQSSVAEVASARLGEWALAGLIALDRVAAARFACVFRAPDDLPAMRRELAAVEASPATDERGGEGSAGAQPALPGLRAAIEPSGDAPR